MNMDVNDNPQGGNINQQGIGMSQFEKDMKAFLFSAEARKIVSDFGSFNLSEDMLDMVAGGNNVRGILTDGISNLNNMFIKWFDFFDKQLSILTNIKNYDSFLLEYLFVI